MGKCHLQIVLSASCGLESTEKRVPYKPLLDKALALSKHRVNKVIMLQASLYIIYDSLSAFES